MVTLAHAELRVIAGDRVSASIEIANPGEVDDEYVVEVHGEAAQWTSVEPRQLALPAGAAGTVQLWFQPVASASPSAAVPFEVEVKSRQLPDQPVVLTGALEVEATEPPTLVVPEPPPLRAAPEPPLRAAPEPPLPAPPEPPPPAAPAPPPPPRPAPPPTDPRDGRRAGPGLVLTILILVIGVVLLVGASAAEDEGDTELADAMNGGGWVLIVVAIVAGIIWLVVNLANRR
jgi:hypothetical protein